MPTVVLLVELVVLFVGVSFLVEILQRRFGPKRLRRWMGGRPVVAALKGIVIGFVTPFCTYSSIPLLVGMRRAGVPPAGYVAFISAAPVLDPFRPPPEPWLPGNRGIEYATTEGDVVRSIGPGTVRWVGTVARRGVTVPVTLGLV